MDMTETQMAVPHSLTLHSRSRLSMTGVAEVAGFDENTVVLRTAMGLLTVQGQELRLKALTPEGGNVVIEGTVSALHYEEPRPAGGWLRRLLG
jgi:sporulation protein YabP